jgi:hypothetical protein
MAKIRIAKKDGTPSQYFWSDTEKSDKSQRTVYKKTDDGVKRMTGVHFDATRMRLVRT